MTIDILLRSTSPVIQAALEAEGFRLHRMAPGEAPPPAPVREEVRVAVTTGFIGLGREVIAGLPRLELICCSGTGYENVDVRAALERGVTVTHGSGLNASAVADHAMAMLLALMRDLGGFDRALREGRWREALQARPIPGGKRLGLVGLGAIGERIARRAEAFEMTIAYHKRQPRADVPWRFVPTLLDLAREADILVIAAPGGAATWHIVGREVLQALGPRGFLVNVGRGSVVDTAALVEALAARTIQGAALDVFEDEPHVPRALLDAPNLLLSPHVASWAPEILEASADLVRRNILRFLAGEPVLTPVPEMTAGR